MKRTTEAAKRQPKAQVRINGKNGRIQNERTNPRSSYPRRTPGRPGQGKPAAAGMGEALEALNHDLERDHLVGIVAAGSEPARIRPCPVREEEAVMENERDPRCHPCGAGSTWGGA